jgi:hypothetical protein
MVARYHHLAIRFAQFGHDPALTSRRAMRRRKNADGDRKRKILGAQTLGAQNLGMQNLGTRNLGTEILA